MHCQLNKSSETMGSPLHFASIEDAPGTPPAWYVAYTESRQEQLASTNLQLQGFLTYLPMYLGNRKNPAKAIAEPMFPRYLFFKPANQKQSISSVRSTRGISAVVRFGSYFAQVQPETLASIQHHEELSAQQNQSAGVLPQRGSRVRLSAPTLNGMEGLVHSVSAQRVIVLMEILGQETRVKLRPHQVEPS
ncbi:transcriptional activator RfaH [Pollutimonas nitritireducens]|uniref:Transcriptional activator RfaH n=1 Tax=Pollutimonas nitritireducens TaxID=2045209 RepID=A0A2N4UD87_9BURK|nr:transcription termination/antitermination NusG family protein [Pollutimonas nitritireducens]PLC52988.1 transcriptional activator RfaH [Pollutimonas nitritireducens]